MRSLLLSTALILPALASAEVPYFPRFARQALDAEVLSWELCPKPEYPRSSARNEEEGSVTLHFTVGADGRLLATRVASSSGYRALDAAAYSALSQCRFRPASIDGDPVQMTMYVQYIWSLE
ncbi:energy transducer TonB [Massilia sp. Dwa41.01b]|uniref:energy transducer TonB n=1 Tax=unclassified Massilia TaxID=2609279 RepID=UPI0016023D0F|nr:MULTISPECIES: energy transducer TonB [unclassified Massilia]QNA89261.1 energy transducer TonB [Massilia sp. Dwa41.01b]QNB00165.1 energy transducer TonB [Massilia sp. Se16.2.3]